MSVNYRQEHIWISNRTDLVHFFTCALILLSPVDVHSRLTVFTNFENTYPRNLFMKTGNQDQPAWSDPANASPSIRLQICHDVGNSGVFAARGMKPVHMNEAVYAELQQPEYSVLSSLLYGVGEYWLAYYNPYRLHAMNVDGFVRNTDSSQMTITITKKEYLFLCLLEKLNTDEEEETSDFQDDAIMNEAESSHTSGSGEESAEDMFDDAIINNAHMTYTDAEGVRGRSQEEDTNQDRDADMSSGEDPGELVTFYVSKEYDTHRGLRAHRFILVDKQITGGDQVHIMLAAESAHAYLRPDFNVELHYIELRKHHEPSDHCEQDPVCKLAETNVHSHRPFQLCATVLSSSYFAGKIQYPSRTSQSRTPIHGFSEQVFFRTREGAQKAAGKVYKEFVLPCLARWDDGDEVAFYISRGYNPNQVFVSVSDRFDGQLYLESLTVDVSVVHELHNFGDIEI